METLDLAQRICQSLPAGELHQKIASSADGGFAQQLREVIANPRSIRKLRVGRAAQVVRSLTPAQARAVLAVDTRAGVQAAADAVEQDFTFHRTRPEAMLQWCVEHAADTKKSQELGWLLSEIVVGDPNSDAATTVMQMHLSQRWPKQSTARLTWALGQVLTGRSRLAQAICEHVESGAGLDKHLIEILQHSDSSIPGLNRWARANRGTITSDILELLRKLVKKQECSLAAIAPLAAATGAIRARDLLTKNRRWWGSTVDIVDMYYAGDDEFVRELAEIVGWKPTICGTEERLQIEELRVDRPDLSAQTLYAAAAANVRAHESLHDLDGCDRDTIDAVLCCAALHSEKHRSGRLVQYERSLLSRESRSAVAQAAMKWRGQVVDVLNAGDWLTRAWVESLDARFNGDSEKWRFVLSLAPNWEGTLEDLLTTAELV